MVRETKIGLRLERNITKDLRTEIRYNHGNLRNRGNIECDDREFNQIRVSVRYEF